MLIQKLLKKIMKEFNLKVICNVKWNQNLNRCFLRKIVLVYSNNMFSDKKV